MPNQRFNFKSSCEIILLLLITELFHLPPSYKKINRLVVIGILNTQKVKFSSIW